MSFSEGCVGGVEPETVTYKTWTICRETGDRAIRGECPVHGGDGCLVVVAPVSVVRSVEEELRQALEVAHSRLRDRARLVRRAERAEADLDLLIRRFALVSARSGMRAQALQLAEECITENLANGEGVDSQPAVLDAIFDALKYEIADEPDGARPGAKPPIQSTDALSPVQGEHEQDGEDDDRETDDPEREATCEVCSLATTRPYVDAEEGIDLCAVCLNDLWNDSLTTEWRSHAKVLAGPPTTNDPWLPGDEGRDRAIAEAHRMARVGQYTEITLQSRRVTEPHTEDELPVREKAQHGDTEEFVLLSAHRSVEEELRQARGVATNMKAHYEEALSNRDRAIASIRADRDRLAAALRKIAGQEPVKNALHPQWGAAHIAEAALSPVQGEHEQDGDTA